MALGRRLLEAKRSLHFGVLRRDQEAEVYGDSSTTNGLFVSGGARYTLIGSVACEATVQTSE